MYKELSNTLEGYVRKSEEAARARALADEAARQAEIDQDWTPEKMAQRFGGSEGLAQIFGEGGTLATSAMYMQGAELATKTVLAASGVGGKSPEDTVRSGVADGLQIAAPIIATAVGGPIVGGIASALTPLFAGAIRPDTEVQDILDRNIGGFLGIGGKEFTLDQLIEKRQAGRRGVVDSTYDEVIENLGDIEKIMQTRCGGKTSWEWDCETGGWVKKTAENTLDIAENERQQLQRQTELLERQVELQQQQLRYQREQLERTYQATTPDVTDRDFNLVGEASEQRQLNDYWANSEQVGEVLDVAG